MSMQFAPRVLPAQIPLLTQYAMAMDIAVGVSVGWHRFRPQAEAMVIKPCLSSSARRHATRSRAEYDRTLSAKTISTGVKQ